MVGTLTATVSFGTNANADFSGGGALAAKVIESYAAAMGLNGSGSLDVASLLPKYQRNAPLSGVGALAFPLKQIYPALIANFLGAGVLSASAIRRHALAAELVGGGSLTGTGFFETYIKPMLLNGAGALAATIVALPTITNIVTAPFHVGDTITITGTNFIAPVTVTIGGVAATSVNVISPTSLTCVIP